MVLVEVWTINLGAQHLLCFYSEAGLDYEPLNISITFEKEDLEIWRRVRIIDDQTLQGKRTFNTVIEAVPGTFPVAVMNNTAAIEIEDDDSELLQPCMYVLTHACHSM